MSCTQTNHPIRVVCLLLLERLCLNPHPPHPSSYRSGTPFGYFVSLPLTDAVHLVATLFRFTHKVADKVLRKCPTLSHSQNLSNGLAGCGEINTKALSGAPLS